MVTFIEVEGRSLECSDILLFSVRSVQMIDPTPIPVRGPNILLTSQHIEDDVHSDCRVNNLRTYHWGQNDYIPFFERELFSVRVTGNTAAWYSWGN